jgi:tape measure domain-containing protein
MRIPGVYVPIRGDTAQLTSDMARARQLITEQARGMSDSINNAISSRQIQGSINALVGNLTTLARSSHLTGRAFEGMGADLGELRSLTGMTERQLASLQSRMLQTQAGNAQERSLRGIATAAGLTARETRALGRQMGLTRAQINNVTNSANDASGAMGGMGRAAKTAMALISVAAIAGTARGILQIADEYTLLESRLKLVTKGAEDLSETQQALYDISLRTHQSNAETISLYTRMARATETLGLSQKDTLQITETINQALIVSGASATESSAALIQLSQGLASGVLRGEEFNSIMEQTPRLAKALADGIGVNIGKLRELAGEGKLTADVVTKAFLSQKDAIGSEFSQMTTTVGQAMTDLSTVVKSIIADTNKTSESTNKIATAILNVASIIDDNRDGIVSLFTEVLGVTGSIIKGLADFGTALEGLGRKSTVRALKEEMGGLNEDLYRAKNGWFGIGKASIEEISKIERRIEGLRELIKEVETGSLYAPKKPKPIAAEITTVAGVVPMKVAIADGKDAAADKAEKEAERQLKLASNLRKKLADVDKSYNELTLNENKNLRRLDLQNVEDNYASKIISLSDYIKKKAAIEIDAAEEEVRVNRETVASYRGVLEGAFQTGTKGLIDKAEATIKLNKSTIGLKDSEASLALLLQKNNAEMAKYNAEQLDYIKNYQIKYNTQIGNFSEAERIRQTTIAYTTELWLLQQAVIDGVAGSQDALVSFQARGVKDIKKTETQEQYLKDDITAGAFGSASQFDAITDKYTEMYRSIRDIEDEYGEQSTEAKMAMWGANIDMARDSIGTITDILMQGNEDQFNAGKALAVSMAIINAALSVSKALTLAYPMNFVVAGLVGAAAGVEVSTIMSQQYQGRANGGPVNAGQTYIVNENRLKEGPEYFTPGVAGTITPARNMDNQRGQRKEVIVNQTINVQGTVDRRTSTQMANDAARKQRVANARFG